MIRCLRVALSVVLFALLGCSGQPPAHHEAMGATGGPAMLLDGFGSYHQAVTTGSPQAQAYFDQGLRLVYAFNHIEAESAFREATRLDPACAMCYWGIALTQGSNYNSPTDAEREKTAYTAVQQALRLTDRVTPRERATIQALAKRHSTDQGADRATLDRAYADAMREVVRSFPDDQDAATLLADALMNLRPWDLWKPDGSMQPETAEILATLERVMSANPTHPGALHLYIHAVEGGPTPAQGERAADQLGPLLPGAGHLVHMPAHIYWRVGRYEDAVQANIRAVKADEAYFAKRAPSPIYRGLYYPHNIDFIWQSASMEGRSAETIRAARQFAEAAPADMVRQMSDMETAPAAPYFALARFGRWEEILRQPAPPAEFPYVTGAWRYSRGLAFIAAGRRPEAEAELAAIRELSASVPADRTLAGFFKTKAILTLADNVLAGEIASRTGQTDVAVQHLLAAVAEQDGHWFTEPPVWYYPVRQSLGVALLTGNRPVEAEAVYRDDLKRNPDNGWSLFGLAESLRAQGKTADADAAQARFQKVWVLADVKLSASRF
jgi:tetratricopeptide (TPR) repeat protein